MTTRVARLRTRFRRRRPEDLAVEDRPAEDLAVDPDRRTHFVDEAVNAAMDRDGFAVLPARLDSDAVESLTALYRGVMDQVGHDTSGVFLPSMMITDPALRATLWDGVREITAPTIDPLFVPGSSAVMGGSFVSKPAAQNSVRNPHQDPSVFDETQHVSISIWIPLSDSDTSNGTLYCLPGSHRMHNHIRPPDVANFDDEVAAYALAESVPIQVEAGQMLAIDGAVVHHSPPNRSDRERVATIVAVRPAGSSMSLMRSEHGADVGTADLYDVGVEMFRSGNLVHPDLDPQRLTRRVPYRPANMADLSASLAGGRRSEPSS